MRTVKIYGLSRLDCTCDETRREFCTTRLFGERDRRGHPEYTTRRVVHRASYGFFFRARYASGRRVSKSNSSPSVPSPRRTVDDDVNEKLQRGPCKDGREKSDATYLYVRRNYVVRDARMLRRRRSIESPLALQRSRAIGTRVRRRE